LFDILITNLVSSLFGKFASAQFPSPVQEVINTAYVKIMGLDMSEFEPPENYKSLNALFTRSLKKRREFPKDNESVISPCDSFITDMGEAKEERVYQIKNFPYKISQVLTEHISDDSKKRVYGGEYINFYLSPKDYHRYHAPMNMKVLRAVHVPGALYPVNFTYLNRIVDLFVKNERVVLECEDDNGRRFFMIFVGALNVGKMIFHFDDRIATNENAKEIKVYDYEKPVSLEKGEEIGYFMMGSTIVMFFEKGMIEFKVEKNTHVKFGDVIGVLR